VPHQHPPVEAQLTFRLADQPEQVRDVGIGVAFVEFLEEEVDRTHHPLFAAVILAHQGDGWEGVHQWAEVGLRKFPCNKVARTIIAVFAISLERYAKSVTHLEWLVCTYPQHPKAKIWTALLGKAREEVAKASKKK
jgi:hypothetical protein